MNKFDQVVLGSLDIAQSDALKRKNTELSPEHLLLGLILNKSSYSSKSMKDNLKEVESMVNALPKTTGQVLFSQGIWVMGRLAFRKRERVCAAWGSFKLITSSLSG